MDKKLYEKTRYQNIYRHKKNKNYVIMISNPKTSISLIDGNRIFDIEVAVKLRDKYKDKSKVVKKSQVSHSELFDTIWSKYIENCKTVENQAYNTIQQKQIIYNSKIKETFGNKKISKIIKKDVVDYIESLNTTDKYKNKILKIIKAFFNWCVKEEYIFYSPATGIKTKKEEKTIMKYWLPEHIKQFFDVLENDINSSNNDYVYSAYLIKILSLLTFSLGDRIGETRVICYSNISKIYSKIEIKHSINYNTKDENFFSKTKTKSSQRELDVSPRIIEAIEKFKEYNEKRLGIKINPDLPILFNYLTNKPYSDTYLRKKFNYYIEKANVPKIRMYDLRHTYVTTMMSEGWELYHISQRLGHTNYSTTVNKYGHISDNTRKEMAKTTDKYF